jgi:hypothetical protein
MADDLILKKLDLIAKELEFLREASVLFAKRQERMQADIMLLENHNLSRHAEILQILHRDRLSIPFRAT